MCKERALQAEPGVFKVLKARVGECYWQSTLLCNWRETWHQIMWGFTGHDNEITL